MPDVIAAVSGHGTEKARMIIVEWRLPRLLLAALLGAALGVSGAIFQSLTRNPLGSPDVIGFAAGAHTGALTIILLLSGRVLCNRRRRHNRWAAHRPTRLPVGRKHQQPWLPSYRDRDRYLRDALGPECVDDPQSRSRRCHGSRVLVSGIPERSRLPAVLAPAFLLLLLSAPIIALVRPMRQMELGEDVALASGIATAKSRLWLTLYGVALTAIVTAVAGPISFVALAAPQLPVGLRGVPVFRSYSPG